MNPSRLRGLSILTGASLMLVAGSASADVEVAPLVVVDLSTFDGSGFDADPAAGQLDSDDWSVRLAADAILEFGGTAGGAGSDFARGTSTGGVDDPGIWAFDVDGAGTIAFGIQPTDQTFTPGQVVLRLINNTGADVTEFQVEYSVWVNNAEDRSNSLNLEHSADDETYVAAGEGFISPETADRDGFVATEFVEVITPDAPIADGSQYYIAWSGDDVAGAGQERDEFGIEGITIRLLNTCGNGLVEGEEVCDDGLDNIDTGACLTTCEAASCGDGFIQDGVETCDDGNTDPGDGCAADCTEEASDTGVDSSGTADDTAGTGDSDSDGVDTGDDMSASATDPTADSADDDDDDDGDSDTDGGANDDDDDNVSCSCSTDAGAAAPFWGLLGLVAFGIVRRRR